MTVFILILAMAAVFPMLLFGGLVDILEMMLDMLGLLSNES